VELGISARAGIEAGLRTHRADASRRARAATEHIVAVADRAGYRAALIDAAAQGSVITWPQFAHMVRAAAQGLSRRGLREDDTAGIFVHDACSHVIAVNAIRAAGAVAAPIRPVQTAAGIAAQLKECRARLLVTSAELADLATQAAERSLVRQVFAFGEADGTTPFGSLLHTARHGQLPADGGTGHHGSNGRYPAEQVLHLAGSDGPAVPPLTRRDVVVAAPPCGDPDAYTSLLDLVQAAGATIVAAPLTQVTAMVGVYKGTAAIVSRGTDVAGLPAGRILAAG